jgi:hypothetical protein
MFALTVGDVLTACTVYIPQEAVQVMNLLIMQPSPASCHFIPLRCKHSPERPPSA